MARGKKRVALLSNITVDLIAAKLHQKYDFYVPKGFDTWVQEIVDPMSALYTESCDAIVILLDGTESRSWKNNEEASEKLSLWEQAVAIATDHIVDIPLFITTIDIRENRIKAYDERKYRIALEHEWYQFVQGKVEEKNNVYLIDLSDAIADIGRNQFYSNKIWYMSSMPYSLNGLHVVVSEIDRALCAAFSSKKKIITLDLDNTLWGGVIGEDGLAGIVLSDHKEGQRYYDFQRQLFEMKKRGIVLAIASKNNPEDAETAIQRHPSMLLRREDFVSSKINWNSKVSNLREIEAELNLTEGSFIFIDDNPIERETMKGECPEVLVPEFPDETAELLPFAEELWFDYCRPLRVIDEDRRKTEMYQSDIKRKEIQHKSLDLDEYIAKLGMIVDIHRMRPEEVNRVAQLCGKTNQFNVTTRRYTQTEIKKIADDPDYAVYVTYVADKYGDSGLVSVIILVHSESDIRIDTFLMSCRVMGRKLENVIIDEIVAHYKEKKKIIGEFFPTAKNAAVKDLYDRLGFTLVSDENGHKTYEFETAGYENKNFDIYKEIHFVV